MTASSPPPPNINSLAYSTPAFYVNQTSITYINGVFRVTFFEQHLSEAKPGEGSPEVNSILAPRVSVVLTPQSASDLLKTFGDLFARGATPEVEGTMQ